MQPLDDQAFLKAFYQSLDQARPLGPNDALYHPLYADAPHGQVAAFDPVDELSTGIEWGGEASVQLFSGYLGTGKSTELRRLAAHLEDAGYVVVLRDMKAYINGALPIDVSDFLISIAGALGEGVAEATGADLREVGYGERFRAFLTRTKITFDELQLGSAREHGAQLKLGLKQDPTFKQKLQKQLEGHLSQLVADVVEFVGRCRARLAEHGRRAGKGRGVVLILDSVEHIRGSTTNTDAVQTSVERLFFDHADKLRFDALHLVYTVPPWLKVRVPGINNSYDAVFLIPCIKVRDRDGAPHAPALDSLDRLVARRGDWARLLGTRARFDRLCDASGGYLRDLFRLLRTALRHGRHRSLPLDDSAIERVIAELRNDYQPLSERDARWLRKVLDSKRSSLGDGRQLGDLVRLFDAHLVMCYRNGEEWYGVHPVVEPLIDAVLGGGPSADPP